MKVHLPNNQKSHPPQKKKKTESMNQSPPQKKKKSGSVLMKSSESPALVQPKPQDPPGRGMDIGIGPQEGHSISVTSVRAVNHWLVFLGDPYIGL